MAGTSPAMTMQLFFGWCRPRPLRATQALERLRHRQHAEVVKAAADDLHANRKALGVVATIDRYRRILGHIPRHGVADMLERLVGIVDGRSELGAEIDDGRDRRNQ